MKIHRIYFFTAVIAAATFGLTLLISNVANSVFMAVWNIMFFTPQQFVDFASTIGLVGLVTLECPLLAIGIVAYYQYKNQNRNTEE